MRSILYMLLGLVLLGAYFGFRVQTAARESKEHQTMQITNVHKAVTQQKGWLNLSRPLAPDDLKGRIVLLDFWTFCCINCIHIIPDLKAIEEEFGDKLTVIGVHSAKFKNEQDTENIRQAVLRYGIEHPVVNDFDFTIWQSFGVHAWPTLILINPMGIIENVYSGEGNKEAIESDVRDLIKTYGDRITTEQLPLALEKDKTPPGILQFPGKIISIPDYQGQAALAVSDSNHHRILILSPEGDVLDHFGSGAPGWKDGAANEAQFNTPQGLAYKNGTLYVADMENHRLRAINVTARTVTTLAGTGEQGNDRFVQEEDAVKTPLSSPWDVAFYPDDAHLVIAMAGLHQLWSYDLAKRTVSVIAGNGRESIDDGSYPRNSLSQPSGVSAHGKLLYFVDSETSSLRALEKGNLQTLIGTGLFDFGYKEGRQGTALMQHPLGVYADEGDVYIADSYNHSIRRYNQKTGILSNFAGHGVRGHEDGPLVKATFNEPNGIARLGNALFVADTNNHRIRRIDLKTEQVTTLTLKEPQEKETAGEAQWSDFLPNTLDLPPVSIAAATPVRISVELKPGWKINAEAPSTLALFEEAEPHRSIASFTLQQIHAGKLSLPPLTEGAYRLQGSLYYCEAKEGAECLIAGIDRKLSVEPGGAAEIRLPLQ